MQPSPLAHVHAPPGFLGWLGQLVRAHRSRLVGYARRRGLGAEEALDAVQDAFVSFLRLPESRAVADVPEDALKLLTTVLHHGLSNRLRGRRRGIRALAALAVSQASAPTESSEALLLRAEELARARGCILRMGELQRRAIMLCLLDELPQGEVARTLGIGDGHFRVLLHRAREHVRNCDDEPEKA